MRELIVFGPTASRSALPAHAERAVSHRRAADLKRLSARSSRPNVAFFHNQEQINGGKNNMFAAMSTVGGWTMGYYDGSKIQALAMGARIHAGRPLLHGRIRRLVLNHQYLICACAPRHRDAPRAMRAKLDANGKMTKKPGSPSANLGAVQIVNGGSGGRPTAGSVNTSQPAYQPSGVPPADGGSLYVVGPEGQRPCPACRRRRRAPRPSATRSPPRASTGPGTRADGGGPAHIPAGHGRRGPRRRRSWSRRGGTRATARAISAACPAGSPPYRAADRSRQRLARAPAARRSRRAAQPAGRRPPNPALPTARPPHQLAPTRAPSDPA